MTDIGSYLSKWDLSNPVALAETASSQVYRVNYRDDYAVLKQLTPAGKKYEAPGALALSYFSGNGAVELFQSDEGAHLVSFAEGVSLKEWVMQGKDTQAAEIICGVLEQLHHARGTVPKEIISLNDRFRSLFKMATQSDCDPIYRLGAKTAEELLRSQQNSVLLHGDIHHSNILWSKKSGWVAIDPQPAVGERTYDVANSFYNPDGPSDLAENSERIASYAQIFSEHLKVDVKRIIHFALAYGCLSACWSIEDGLSPGRALRIVRLTESLSG